MTITSRKFDQYTLQLRKACNIGYLSDSDGICLVIKTKDQMNHVTVDEDMFGEGWFASIETNTYNTRDCYICGKSGENLERYQKTGFVLHQECRDEFKENIITFLNNSSEDILIERL